ncbi:MULTISPECIES: carboxymuconolactone decarboxylase family protein [unclassified Caballeronia]|uniref:carboxymuconolactone decarboxylase family protein n=1 Tax=unclassified Caballeronia TaxID=2646786 RepID=UPI0020290BED|nr:MULTISPECIES: carboxymuconolactone decarboxylase family protein [unclassified Caballeronia]MDR5765850.1 carboxymuconolactone decarboxylase family protein [Caballeronia sp. LZ028]
MAETNEALDYINEMARVRGYVLPYHKRMAAADMDALKAANNLVAACYTDQRRLSKETKELIFITSLTVLRATPGQIAAHIRVALDLGVSKEEILEAIEITLPECGVVTFQHGFEVWADVCGIKGIEPTVSVHDGSK